MSYFHLLPSCVVTYGYNRSLLFDTQTARHCLLSNDAATALEKLSGLHTDVLRSHMLQQGMAEVDFNIWINLLAAEGFVFLSPVRVDFQPLSNDHDLPFAISNAIIDIATTNLHLLPQIVAAFHSVTCPHLQLRLYADVVPGKMLLDMIVQLTTADALQTTTLIMPFFEEYCLLEDLLKPTSITQVILYRAGAERTETWSDGTQLVLIADVLDLPGCCGITGSAYFTFNIGHYTESQQHNSCLNRKLSIDAYGHIRNCPSMAESYGNVADTTFAAAMEKIAFTKYWYLTKDQVAVCRDCEFRHVCTDCRAYIEDPGDVYSKPLKCGYDPYTCSWQEWSTHPAKQAAIAYYSTLPGIHIL